MKSQRGAAAIYLVFLLVPLFGTVFLALEGTRYIQKKNRLGDATEAATLAVTMANRDDKDQSYEIQLARDYVSSYMRNTDEVSQIKIEREEAIDHYPMPDGTFEEREYTQYRVTAKTEHSSWLHSDLIPSFNATETLANRALARAYPEYLGDRDVDIVFVSDFSGSMEDDKIDSLKAAITQVANVILIPRDGETDIRNRIALVPYNMRVVEENQQHLCMTQLKYRNPSGKTDDKHTSYESISWTEWANISHEKVEDCSKKSRKCSGLPGPRADARTIMSVMDDRRYPDNEEWIDYSQTVNEIFIESPINVQHHPKKQRLYSAGICGDSFWTIPLTNQKSKIMTVKEMSPDGGTSVYQGVLRGAQILDKGRPTTPNEEEDKLYKKRLKMLLMISDGKEDPYKNTFSTLVDKGMCNKIRERFNDGDIPVHMGVIGIQFSASGQKAFKKCVGEENIIDVDDLDDLIQEILDLIKKGAKSDGIPKLYYRHTES
ncbi:pilus assembly protein [Shewanella sp. D64]|uniref:TadE/TadG family type IV pilus assembly protein n=1 Tax=unclassified Shewanella TaxID=196818 RepID=UPI0022BA4F35|nr:MULTISPECIES: TadE/TadG family type IV pilus assembly protein [unclassified Shewanella]MEC4725714.1 pilus assembly protein [Shewanella sp. D64]MEC4737679.1 pilus assembly protein [Shewanella sp. E94]WBJ93486.1 pilus assembly protein [Shewanella sp. MTB7]